MRGTGGLLTREEEEVVAESEFENRQREVLLLLQLLQKPDAQHQQVVVDCTMWPAPSPLDNSALPFFCRRHRDGDDAESSSSTRLIQPHQVAAPAGSAQKIIP